MGASVRSFPITSDNPIQFYPTWALWQSSPRTLYGCPIPMSFLCYTWAFTVRLYLRNTSEGSASSHFAGHVPADILTMYRKTNFRRLHGDLMR